MAYPIKNTAVSQINSVKTGGFYIGVNQGGYGLTSATSFWNGKTPDVGRYIVYVGNGTSSPTMYIVLSDSNLITLSNTLGGGSNTTVQLALNYFINSANSVCVNIDIPNILWLPSLLLYIDAGYTPSYPRAFDTWYDISSVNNNISLINSPTFNSDNYGIIRFDGVNDFGASSSASFNLDRRVTVNVWVKHYPGATSDYGNYVAKGANQGYRMRRNGPNGSPLWLYSDGNTIQGGTLYNDIWYMVTGVFDSTGLSAYIDGDLVASNTNPYNPSNVSSTELFIGAIYVGAEYLTADIASVAIYGTALTETQIKQNYYAGLQKLIPTSGLVLWLDGENTNTRVITPTTAYDMSGGNYNGSLNNGVVLGHRDGGTVFSFDGVDDYIVISNPLNQSNLTQVWSVSVWVKQNTGTSGPQYIINGLNNGIASDWYGSGPLLYLNGGVNDYYTYTSTYASIAGTGWRHLVYLFQNSTGLRQIYKDGVLAGSGVGPNYTSTPSGQAGTWYLGQMSGKIGDIRVYNRLLTQTEITTLYKEGILRYGL
jgi:hypothetical protein